jgi:hypothetical protein
MCDLDCPVPGSWTNMTCSADLLICQCFKEMSPPCVVHVSRTHSGYFIFLQTIEAIIYVAVFVALILLIYLYNRGKKKRITVLNMQLALLILLQIGP